MKIKTKLTLGVGLFFILIILLGLVGIWYINALKSDTENILIDNYKSLEYSKNILSSLEDTSQKFIENIGTNIGNQEKNITEIGEGEATAELRDNFSRFTSGSDNNVVRREMRKSIFKIMDTNMQAIQRKSEVAEETADTAVFWIAITATLCFLISFTLLINLPSSIADPVEELTRSIKQIAAKNYSERVDFESHSEFGELAKSFNTMAEKLEEYNDSNLAKLMMEKKRIETLINNMHDPVIGVDENLKVIFSNEEAIKIIGLAQKDLINHPAQELAVKNDLMRMLIQDLANTNTVTDSGKSKPLKIFANGREGYFDKEILHISIIPTGEQHEQLIGHVIVLRNITEYKELDFAKTNFISTVSHEFKTPISSIQMTLQLLENKQIGDLNDEQKNLLESIKGDTGRLLKITGELLNMTQVESGNIQLSIAPTDPQEIVSYALNANKTQADQKQIIFEISRPDNLPKVQADNEKTAWVLTNLISNAIRYSYDNSTIYVSIEKVDKKVKFTVKDTGQGIAPQYKDKIFDRYFRVPGTKKDGTGLGLAISKEFMEAQGGQITVDSEYGAGSTFAITLNALA